MLKNALLIGCALTVLTGTAGAQTGGTIQASGKPQAGPAGQADPWMVRSTKLQFVPRSAPDSSFQLDVPKKDWMVIPAAGNGVLAMVTKKGDAVVEVERSPLRQALDPGDISDLFAQIEMDAIKERQPKASDFQSKVLESAGRRLVAIQFSRPGVLGVERVRQYTIPVGTELYRLTCVSSAAQFPKLDPLFSHVAASFAAVQ